MVSVKHTLSVLIQCTIQCGMTKIPLRRKTTQIIQITVLIYSCRLVRACIIIIESPQLLMTAPTSLQHLNSLALYWVVVVVCEISRHDILANFWGDLRKLRNNLISQTNGGISFSNSCWQIRELYLYTVPFPYIVLDSCVTYLESGRPR